MPDPFEQLRQPAPGVEPDVAFAIVLRARLERALVNSDPPPERSSIVTTVPLGERAPTPAGRPAASPPARPRLIPYLAVDGAAAAIDWYVAALGARLTSDPFVMPGNRIGHAELEFAGALLYLADSSPESHVAGPRPGDDATVTLVLEVDSVDATVERAVSSGALVERDAADYPYGRNAIVRDPFAHRWMISGPVLADAGAPADPGDAPDEAGADEVHPGDIGYVSLCVRDEPRGRRFFAEVLGWSESEHHREVPWPAVPHGFFGGVEQPTLFCSYAVDDIDRALDEVRANGGVAGAPASEPWGRSADCTDPEGLAFALHELPPAGSRRRRSTPNGERHGDVAYVTMQSVDSAGTRAFYSAVLGWRFEPGRVEDGWVPAGVAPMTGLSGGHDHPSIVPMYRVDDIHTAVERVRAAGGTASEPGLQAYGWSSECRDDQGTAFYLGQL